MLKKMLLGCTVFTLAISTAHAEELTVSSWVAPSHPTIASGYSTYFPAVEKATDGELTFKLISGGALMGGKETLTGLSDGIADASVLALTYHPAQLPYGQLIADLAMASGNSLAVAGAVTEFTMLECEPCQAEFASQNVVYTGSYATAPYALISKQVIDELEDLKGLRVRSPGGAWDRWIEAAEGVVVHTSSSEMYEALDRGMIDIAMQPAASLKSHSLWDVADNITLASLGVYNSGPLLAFNADTWGDLGAAHREAILDNMGLALVSTTRGYLALNNEALEDLDAHDVTATKEPEKIEAFITSFNKNDEEAVVTKARDVYGIDDPAPYIATYKALLSKWEGLVSLEMDPQQAAAIFQSEIFDKVDTASYGM